MMENRSKVPGPLLKLNLCCFLFTRSVSWWAVCCLTFKPVETDCCLSCPSSQKPPKAEAEITTPFRPPVTAPINPSINYANSCSHMQTSLNLSSNTWACVLSLTVHWFTQLLNGKEINWNGLKACGVCACVCEGGRVRRWSLGLGGAGGRLIISTEKTYIWWV